MKTHLTVDVIFVENTVFQFLFCRYVFDSNKNGKAFKSWKFSVFKYFPKTSNLPVVASPVLGEAPPTPNTTTLLTAPWARGHTLAATIFRKIHCFYTKNVANKVNNFWNRFRRYRAESLRVSLMIKKRFSHHIKLRERICDLNRPVYFYQIYKPDSELTGTIWSILLSQDWT